MLEITDSVIEVQEDTKIDDEKYVEVKNPYGFIYITTNLINGKRYLGQRKFYEDWQTYLGSGSLLHRAIKKYGKANFKREIVLICYSCEELNQAEYELSVFFNVVESDSWYNLVFGGGSTTGLHHTDETKQKLREYNLGKKMSESAKKKISQTLSRVMTGRTFSDEHKKHISEARTGLNNPGYQPVYCIELDEIFWSAKAAEDKYRIDNGSICKCCRGSRQTIGKHPTTEEKLHWKYVYDRTLDNKIVAQGAISLGYITQERTDNYLNELMKKGD